MRRTLLILAIVAGLTLLARGAVPCEAVAAQPHCYVALHPGPATNTLDLVEIAEARPISPAGELLLTTVAVEADLDLLEWIQGALSPRIEQVSRESVFPPGQDEDLVDQQNAALMVASQIEAEIAALRAVGYDLDEDFDGAEIMAVSQPNALDDDQLRVGDILTSIAGRSVTSAREAVEVLTTFAPGDTVTIDGLRDGAAFSAEIDLIAAPDEPGRPYVGVVLIPHIELPVEIEIDAGGVGGPSGGLSFALTIVQLLEGEDLTGGAVVGVTGTIDSDGNVGGVGGVEQKVLGATSRRGDERNATVFLVPAGNFDEAAAARPDNDVLLVPVATLDEALAALADIRAGAQPAGALALSAP